MLHVDLQEVSPGNSSNRDIAVGISGFGSARLVPGRWESLGKMTGRKTFGLSWPAQVFPKMSGSPVSWASNSLVRFRMSQLASCLAVRFLLPWCERWHRQNRRVLLAGFSLGGHIALEVARKVPGLEILTICAAHPEGRVEGLEHTRCLVHVYGGLDAALRVLFPMVTGAHALGIAPLPASVVRAVNVDASKVIGTDHMKASRLVVELLKAGIELGWGLDSRWFGGLPELKEPLSLHHSDPLMASWMQAAQEGNPQALAWSNGLVDANIDAGSPGSSDRERGRFRLALSRHGVLPDHFRFVQSSSPEGAAGGSNGAGNWSDPTWDSSRGLPKQCSTSSSG